MRFLCARLARAGPTTAPLETAGIGARPVGPGVAIGHDRGPRCARRVSSRKALAIVGRDNKCAPPSGKVSQGLNRIRLSCPGLAPEEDVVQEPRRPSARPVAADAHCAMAVGVTETVGMTVDVTVT